MLGRQPMWAQQHMTEPEFAVLVEAAARSLRRLMPELVSAVVADFGCDPDATYVGPPTLVTTTGQGFMAFGLGLPQHPHRDTWYAASACQVNWWMPLYRTDDSSLLAFHPQYWDLPVHNSSADFDYDTWSAGVGVDPVFGDEPLAQPRSLDPIELTPDIRISCAAAGVILSSAAHLCSTVPNETLRTHFTVTFRTVHEDDLVAGTGPANLDAAPRGTSLPGFVRCSDLSPIPEELVRCELSRRGYAASA